MGGGINMEETVTLKLGRYEALRDKARRVDALEKGNQMLKEDLAIAHKHLEGLQQPKKDTSTYTVKLDGSEVYEAVKKAVDEVTKELEEEESSNGIILYDKKNPYKKVVFTNKGIRLYESDTLISSKTK